MIEKKLALKKKKPGIEMIPGRDDTKLRHMHRQDPNAPRGSKTPKLPQKQVIQVD